MSDEHVSSIEPDSEHTELVIYPASGTLGCHGYTFSDAELIVLKPGQDVTLQAPVDTRPMLPRRRTARRLKAD